jgi:hypothetical protein
MESLAAALLLAGLAILFVLHYEFRRREDAYFRALLALDLARLPSAVRDYGLRLPREPVAFLQAVHRLRAMERRFPEAIRRESRVWLAERGIPLPDQA